MRGIIYVLRYPYIRFRVIEGIKRFNKINDPKTILIYVMHPIFGLAPRSRRLSYLMSLCTEVNSALYCTTISLFTLYFLLVVRHTQDLKTKGRGGAGYVERNRRPHFSVTVSRTGPLLCPTPPCPSPRVHGKEVGEKLPHGIQPYR